MLERHGSDGNVSIRYRDLVDLILIIGQEKIDGAQLHGVLRAEVARRQARGIAIELPQHFAVPDVELWTTGYAKQAASVDGFDEFRTLPLAERLAALFIDPLLDDDPPSTWNPGARAWQ